MVTLYPVIQNLDQLRDYVNYILCQYNQLELDAFPLTERMLVRADQPCGIYFCLHGPRAVKFSAIWENKCNTVLFYGATGERIHKVQLIEAPQLSAIAA